MFTRHILKTKLDYVSFKLMTNRHGGSKMQAAIETQIYAVMQRDLPWENDIMF